MSTTIKRPLRKNENYLCKLLPTIKKSRKTGVVLATKVFWASMGSIQSEEVQWHHIF